VNAFDNFPIFITGDYLFQFIRSIEKSFFQPSTPVLGAEGNVKRFPTTMSFFYAHDIR
jgi:hypothetical protein